MKQLKNIGLVFCILLLSSSLKAQISFNELSKAMQQQPRFIIMNIHDDNCLYCMMQDKRLQKDKALQNRLHNEVYFLEWNIKEQPDFTFNGEKYIKNDKNPYAGTAFLDKYAKDPKNPIGFPVWLIFDGNYKVIYHYFGLLPNKSLNKMLDILQKAQQKAQQR